MSKQDDYRYDWTIEMETGSNVNLNGLATLSPDSEYNETQAKLTFSVRDGGDDWHVAFENSQGPEHENCKLKIIPNDCAIIFGIKRTQHIEYIAHYIHTSHASDEDEDIDSYNSYNDTYVNYFKFSKINNSIDQLSCTIDAAKIDVECKPDEPCIAEIKAEEDEDFYKLKIDEHYTITTRYEIIGEICTNSLRVFGKVNAFKIIGMYNNWIGCWDHSDSTYEANYFYANKTDAGSSHISAARKYPQLNNNNSHGNIISGDNPLELYDLDIEIFFDKSKLSSYPNMPKSITYVDTNMSSNIYYSDNDNNVTIHYDSSCNYERHSIVNTFWVSDNAVDQDNSNSLISHTNSWHDKINVKVPHAYKWPKMTVNIDQKNVFGVTNGFLLCDQKYRMMYNYKNKYMLSSYIETVGNKEHDLRSALIFNYSPTMGDFSGIMDDQMYFSDIGDFIPDEDEIGQMSVSYSIDSINSTSCWESIIDQQRLCQNSKCRAYNVLDDFPDISNKFLKKQYDLSRSSYIGAIQDTSIFQSFQEKLPNKNSCAGLNKLAGVFTANSYAELKSNLKRYKPANSKLQFAGFVNISNVPANGQCLSSEGVQFFPWITNMDDIEIDKFFMPIHSIFAPVFFAPGNLLINEDANYNNTYINNSFEARKTFLTNKVKTLSSDASNEKIDIGSVSLYDLSGNSVQGHMKMPCTYDIIDVEDSRKNFIQALKKSSKYNNTCINMYSCLINKNNSVMYIGTSDDGSLFGINKKDFINLLNGLSKKSSLFLTCQHSALMLGASSSVYAPNNVNARISDQSHFYVIDTVSNATKLYDVAENNTTFTNLIANYLMTIENNRTKTVDHIISIRKTMVNAYQAALNSLVSFMNDLYRECLLKKVKFIDSKRSSLFSNEYHSEYIYKYPVTAKAQLVTFKNSGWFSSKNNATKMIDALVNDDATYNIYTICFLNMLYSFIGYNSASKSKYSWYNSFIEKNVDKSDDSIYDHMLRRFFLDDQCGFFNPHVVAAANSNYLENDDLVTEYPENDDLYDFHEKALEQFNIINRILIEAARNIYENTVKIFKNSDEKILNGVDDQVKFKLIMYCLLLNGPHCGFLKCPENADVINVI